MYSDHEAMKRQSTVLLATAASDTRLTQALMQIEQLTNELETQKHDSKEKVARFVPFPSVFDVLSFVVADR